MDQNGKRTEVGSLLEELANERRANELAKLEARQDGNIHGSKTWDKNVEPPKLAPVMPITEAVTVAVAESKVVDEGSILTSAEAARLLGYSEKSFRNMVSDGKVPHYKLFGQNRFKKSELMGLLVKVETK